MAKKSKFKPPQCPVCAGQYEPIAKFPIKPSAIRQLDEHSYAIMQETTTCEGGILAYGNKIVKVISKKKLTAFRQWLRALEYFDYKCAYCEVVLTQQNITRDHFVPKYLGGSNAIENIVPSCMECNHAKANTHPTDWCSEEQLEKIYTYIWALRMKHHGHDVEWKAICIST